MGIGVLVEVAVNVGVEDGVSVTVGVGVTDGVPHIIVPINRNKLSGPDASRQLVLRSQFGQPRPNPPPGFCQAAPEFDVTTRSLQPHWPPELKSRLACTETQKVPDAKTQSGGRSIPNEPVSAPVVIGILSNVHTPIGVPGSPDESR